MDLAEFLLARIAEDEEWAQAMIRIGERRGAAASPNDMADLLAMVQFVVSDPEAQALIEKIEVSRVRVPTDVRRVSAECEAKRRIVELHSGREAFYDPDELRLLALPYADHPDYDEAWKP